MQIDIKQKFSFYWVIYAIVVVLLTISRRSNTINFNQNRSNTNCNIENFQLNLMLYNKK